MSILIRDPGADAKAAAEYQDKVDTAMAKGTAWPQPVAPSTEEIEFSEGIASSESVYRNFTQPGGSFGRGLREARELDESSTPRPDPVSVSKTPFKLGGK